MDASGDSALLVLHTTLSSSLTSLSNTVCHKFHGIEWMLAYQGSQLDDVKQKNQIRTICNVLFMKEPKEKVKRIRKKYSYKDSTSLAACVINLTSRQN